MIYSPTAIREYDDKYGIIINYHCSKMKPIIQPLVMTITVGSDYFISHSMIFYFQDVLLLLLVMTALKPGLKLYSLTGSRNHMCYYKTIPSDCVNNMPTTKYLPYYS